MSIEQRPKLVAETFSREKDVVNYFTEKNWHPRNYQVLYFKRGRVLILRVEESLSEVETFDIHKEEDYSY